MPRNNNHLFFQNIAINVLILIFIALTTTHYSSAQTPSHLAQTLPSTTGRYTFEDLKVLGKTQSYQEFLQRAHDIRPSNRDDKWNKLVEDMALKFLDHLIQLRDIPNDKASLFMRVSSWPIFRTNEFYITKRDILFIQKIENCFAKKRHNCKTLTSDLFNNHTHPLEFQFQLAEILHQHGHNSAQIWPFIKLLVKDKLSEFYCKKEPLKSLVINQAYLEVSKQPKNFDN